MRVLSAQNPGTGRWTTQDPLGFAAGDADLHGYVGNNPVDGIDPAGLEAVPAEPWWTKFPNFRPKQGWWYNNGTVQEAIKVALEGSFPNGPNGPYTGEQGGWIYYNPKTHAFKVSPFPAGSFTHIDPKDPEPPPGFCTVGFFHVHPDHTYAGKRDQLFSKRHKVPDLVIAPNPDYPPEPGPGETPPDPGDVPPPPPPPPFIQGPKYPLRYPIRLR
jgi:hypothetical protein